MILLPLKTRLTPWSVKLGNTTASPHRKLGIAKELPIPSTPPPHLRGSTKAIMIVSLE